jgi:mono/diheme cytochrome c family protein
MKQEYYQWALIGFSGIVMATLSFFVYKEVFPEYKLYQNRYVELEAYRAQQLKQPPAPFKKGIKQIVMPTTPTGPVEIDRCSSCHVAMDLPHFMPMRVSTDIKGQIRRDARGRPILEPNPDYIWHQVDEKIAQLEEGTPKEQAKAQEMKAWSQVQVGSQSYDMRKALAAHPLLAGETRPFEYHALEEFGCSVCHSGNGRALTTVRAHGPVFDGQYPEEHSAPEPVFQENEKDPPEFAKVFNHKPGSSLLFQTTPILVGSLVEARCVDCHQSDNRRLEELAQETERLKEKQQGRRELIKRSIEEEKGALVTLCQLWINLKAMGFEKTLQSYETLAGRWDQSPREKSAYEATTHWLHQWKREAAASDALPEDFTREKLLLEMEKVLGDKASVQDIVQMLERDSRSAQEVVERFLERSQSLPPLAFLQASLKEKQKQQALKEEEIDPFHENLASWQQGQNLFLSQACYACHKIERFSRGAVGPELTRIGLSYPWYVKESIVWPQADLASSTMPNFKLDHEDLEDLMTFLMSQRGPGKNIANVQYKLSLKDWEAGAKLPWERPVATLDNLEESARIFASEGCASCHRLKGFESEWGFSNEKLKRPLAAQDQKEFFEKFFPQQLNGHELVASLALHRSWIDQNLEKVRPEGILDRLHKKYPGLLLSYHTPFKVAQRLLKTTNSDPKDSERLQKVFWAYLQVWGLGREIGPYLHGSGVHRSKAWLMDHFKNPQSSVARSIMPVFPFDTSKFEALIYMLEVLGRKNRDEWRLIWDIRGFDPEKTYSMLCAQCHGNGLLGNGPVAEWIYPIPKNLRQPTFLRHLTKERAIHSIAKGIPGGPMPGWSLCEEGQSPILKEEEVAKIVDWLFTNLPGAELVPSERDIPKWNWTPEQIEKEILEDPDYKELKAKDKEDTVQRPPLASVFEAQVQKAPQSEIFDLVPSSQENEASWSYFLKEKFYTQANVDAAWPVFMEHCAHCHGAKGAGDGLRSVTMKEAKPRMLTNIHWLSSKDDVRLLRSIKFGVPGTAMTSFADVTTPMQRLQLVVLIRSLSLESQMRDAIEAKLKKRLDLLSIEASWQVSSQHLYEIWMKFSQRLIGNFHTRLFYKAYMELLETLAPVKAKDSGLDLSKLKSAIEASLKQVVEERAALSGQLLGESLLEKIEAVDQKREALETLKAQLEQTYAMDQDIRQHP